MALRTSAIAFLSLCLTLGATSCNRAHAPDAQSDAGIPGTIYVKQVQGAGYTAVDGDVVGLTCEFVRMNTIGDDGKKLRLLYTREAVHRVELPHSLPADDGRHAQYGKWKKLADTCWNQDKSRFVGMAQSAPFLGKPLGFLDNLPPGVGILIAVVVLLGWFSYGGFRLYDFLLVAMKSNALNREKLQKEVDKLGYEIDELKQKLGERVAQPVLEATQPGELTRVFSQPSPQIGEFFRRQFQKITTDTGLDRRRAELRERWQQSRKRTGRAPTLKYYSCMALNWLLTLLAALYCLTFLVYAPALTVMPEFADLGLGAKLGASFVCLVCSVVLGLAWRRLNLRRRILRIAYYEVMAAPA